MTAPSSSSLEIDYYLERVGEALADLPQEVRDDLMEDLPAHFAEVLEEQGGPLVERLGPPAAYAAELRAAAGIEAGGRNAGAARIDLERLRGRLRIVDERGGRLIGYEHATDFLRLLRPAWWVARGVAIVVLIFAMDILPADRIDDPLGWVLMAAAAIVSVRLGALGRPRMHRFVGYGITALGVIGVLVIAVNLERLGGSHTYLPQSSYNPYEGVVDVYPVDQDGRPLQNVTLYDQNGNPISLGDAWRCYSGQGPEPRATPAYPLCPLGRTAPSEGAAPRPTATPTPTTTPAATPAPTPTPTTSASADPSPSGSPSASG
ncbi:HAAS signaling domain-containing protein [Dactylosporangium sp. CA-052675]|uniref:HAAS signaling domain-containing protein n=1 Tax=Dactylosporangium sp. CA-052675 TaxID=3239927 RepID=UPI003D900985